MYYNPTISLKRHIKYIYKKKKEKRNNEMMK